MGNCPLQVLNWEYIHTEIDVWQFPIWKGVKQNERNHCRRRRICGGHAVLVHPGRGAGGPADGGNEAERGMGCRQEGQTGGSGRGITGDMRRTGRVTVNTVISGKESGKAAARRNVITFSRRRVRHQWMFPKILCRRNLAEMAVAAVKDVHTAGIPHVSVTV